VKSFGTRISAYSAACATQPKTILLSTNGGLSWQDASNNPGLDSLKGTVSLGVTSGWFTFTSVVVIWIRYGSYYSYNVKTFRSQNGSQWEINTPEPLATVDLGSRLYTATWSGIYYREQGPVSIFKTGDKHGSAYPKTIDWGITSGPRQTQRMFIRIPEAGPFEAFSILPSGKTLSLVSPRYLYPGQYDFPLTLGTTPSSNLILVKWKGRIIHLGQNGRIGPKD